MESRSWTCRSGPPGILITDKYLTIAPEGNYVQINQASVTPKEARTIAEHLLACALQVEVRNTVRHK